MEVFLIRALQLILSLSILVLVHEFGHFIFSRIFKVRVERFYMFFNPLFSIFRAKKINGKLRFSWFSRKAPEAFETEPNQTEFGLGWVPLGGYCAISGMIDESLNKEQMAQPAQPWEFRTKPAGQRLLIMVGGVLFNFILALCIYSTVLNVWGDEYLPVENATMGMDFSPAAHQAGFVDGDIFVAADGVKLERFNDVALRQIVEASEVTVIRDKKEQTVKIPFEFMNQIIAGGQGFAGYRFPAVIKEVMKGSPCEKAGLMAGDSLTAIQGKTVATFSDFVQTLTQYKDSLVQLTYYRNGIAQNVVIQPNKEGQLGFFPKRVNEIFQTRKQEFSLVASVPAGIHKGLGKLTGYASDMKYAFTKEGAKSLGGFGAIGSLFPAEWDWKNFWETTAFLSIILAFMNVLPIPALDGGHILFLFYEIIARRKPSDKFMEYAQMTGMFLLFALLIYANGNDLYRLLFK
ncbi:MAG: RIP metalloprotease RseP [Bacteroidales bacterium]|nr:RIP metalloprotease RseP [Bacteroidales bacterium]